jgi:hypothetical protein
LAHPEAAAEQHLLAALLDSAAAPPTREELTGEVAAAAAFMLAASDRVTRYARSRRGVARRARAIAVGITAASVLGFSSAAATGALPAPVQELAHRTFDAPAPRLPRTPSTSVPASVRPASVPGASRKGQHGAAKTKPKPVKGKGKGNAEGKGNAQAKGNGNAAKGKGNGNAGKGNASTPPGHQKKGVSLSLTASQLNWAPEA